MEDGTLERVGAWCTLLYLVLFGTGWLILGHFFPPFSPADSAAQTAELFEARRIPIMLGAVAMMVSTMVLMPFSALVVLIVRAVEGRMGILTLTMAFTLVTYQVMNFYVPFSFAMATFRPDRDPELVQFAGDWGFMQFMGGIPMFWMIWIVLAVAALAPGEGGRPLLPRWFGYVNLWSAILYVPELLIFFFKTGPFAWDGIVGFWIPAIVFIVWFLVAFLVFLSIARRGLSEVPAHR
jgi:hypothetical protein